MKFNKITPGFVIQTFDTEQKKYVGQEFVAGDPVEYETLDGEVLTDETLEKLGDEGVGPKSEVEPYLPFNMVQPNSFSFAPWKPPFRCRGICIEDADGQRMIDIRGWGFLMGRGSEALGMDEDAAATIQDNLGKYLAELLNAQL